MMDLEEQINFTNKLKHPTNANKAVYRHWVREQAEYFSELLVDAGIDFETQVDEEDQRKPTYFGVSRQHERQADRLNFIALGKNRSKFISSRPIRWIVIGISVLIVALAILGAILSP